MGKRNKNRRGNRRSKFNNIEEVSVDNTGTTRNNPNSPTDNSVINGNITNQDNNVTTPEDIQKLLIRVSEELVALNLAKNAAEAMNIDESERIFYDRKVRPLVDSMYFLGLTSSSIIATGQAFNSNQNGRRRDVKQALDLSSDINKEIECIFKTFQKRMKLYRCGIEKQLGCCNGNCDSCKVDEE